MEMNVLHRTRCIRRVPSLFSSRATDIAFDAWLGKRQIGPAKRAQPIITWILYTTNETKIHSQTATLVSDAHTAI